MTSPTASPCRPTAPIPQEVAKCHTQRGEYGRYVISTGPYMTEGADKLDISSCGSQKPISGFNPNTGLKLVRNPNYDPATDDTEIRESFPDRFEIGVNTNLDNIFDKIERGELEGSFETPPNAVLRRYLQDESIRDRLRVNSGDRMWYMYMNLTVPPFDDVHVRKAMNLVMDLEGVQRVVGRPGPGHDPDARAPAVDDPPGRLLPVPAASVRGRRGGGQGGDEAVQVRHRQGRHLRRARSARASSSATGTSPRGRTMSPIIQQSASQIGIQLETRELSRSAIQIATGEPKRKLPTSSGTGWGKDYADPSTFMVLFDGRNILPEGNSAQALVGLTAAKAKEVGADIPASGPPPSVDADIDACAALAGPGADGLLDHAGQEDHRGDRPLGPADGRHGDRPARPGRDQVRVRPVRHRDGPRPRGGGPEPAELGRS